MDGSRGWSPYLRADLLHSEGEKCFFLIYACLHYYSWYPLFYIPWFLFIIATACSSPCVVCFRDVQGEEWVAEDSHLHWPLPWDGSNVCEAICWYLNTIHIISIKFITIYRWMRLSDCVEIWMPLLPNLETKCLNLQGALKYCWKSTASIWLTSSVNDISRSRWVIHLQSPQTGEAGGGGAAALHTVSRELHRQWWWFTCCSSAMLWLICIELILNL